MLTILLIICLAIWPAILIVYKPQFNIVKSVVLGLCGFFCLYMTVCAVFFALDVFEFIPSLRVTAAMEAVLLAALIYRRRKAGVEIRPELDLRPVAIPLAVALISLPFIMTKNEFYSMGQDEGTYQVKALALMNGYNENYMEMEEFQNLEEPSDRQKYLDFIYGQNNFYLPRFEWETDYDASNFESIVGTIHGLPTYSALLALTGLVFGMEHMIEVQTVLYILFVFLSFMAAEGFVRNRVLQAFVTLLCAFSPINVWLAKSSLTETYLSMVIALFVYMISAAGEAPSPAGEQEPTATSADVSKALGDQRPFSHLSFIPILAFGAVHISLFAFMPIFALVFLMMTAIYRDRGYLISMALSALSYCATALWALAIAPYYTYGNYTVVDKLTKGLINENNLAYVIIVLSALMAAIALAFVPDKPARALFSTADRLRTSGEGSPVQRGGRLALRAFLVLSVACFFYIGVIKADYTRYFEYLQISAYIYLSGLVLIPFIYIYLMIRPKSVLKAREGVLFVLFAYCIIFYSLVLKKDMLFYYYYARYCSQFILLIFLMAAVLAAELKSSRLRVLLFALALLSFIPYDVGLIYQKDHTRLEWSLLSETAGHISERDALIVGPDEQQILWIYPLKFLTGCDVYHADEDLPYEIALLEGLSKYDNIYYLDYKKTELPDELEHSEVFSGTDHLSHLDYRNITCPLTPIPLNYVQYQLEISLHRLSVKR